MIPTLTAKRKGADFQQQQVQRRKSDKKQLQSRSSMVTVICVSVQK
uniref:Small EDRK-rich factor-like N-terminal domain-containing protein n=1 Tax=Ascaris lumbricoides TaxID=6252 RepID=A0A0M3HSS5_ASCLU